MPSISVKEAVSAAKRAIEDLFEDQPLRALALEEIELVNKDGKEVWDVTMGFHRQRAVSNANDLGLMFGSNREVEHRVYKTVEIDAATGDFLRMVIRPTP